MRYCYHADGLVSTLHDNELNYRACRYDVRNRLLSVGLPDPSNGDLLPDTATVSGIRTYNDLGELTADQDYAGDRISYASDNYGRLTGATRPGSVPDTACIYNNRGQLQTLRHGPPGPPVVPFDFTYDGPGGSPRATHRVRRSAIQASAWMTYSRAPVRCAQDLQTRTEPVQLLPTCVVSRPAFSRHPSRAVIAFG